MKKRRKIAVVTGSRADYGYLLPVIRRIYKSDELQLRLIITGMHLSPRHGNTCRLIERDGFNINAKVPMLPMLESWTYMPEAIGDGIKGIALALDKLSPDILLVFGDRIETLAGAIAGSYMNIVVAHMHGGDRSKGDIDERARHAITKMSHLHFPATRLSAKRIRKMGERKELIFPVGSTTIDVIKGLKLKTRKQLGADLGLDDRDFVLVLQNPVTTEPQASYAEMKETLLALRSFPELAKVVVMPNADAGYLGINRAIEEFKKEVKLKVFINLERLDYLSLFNYARALIGNSSSGIIEAPSFKLPAINLGIRQAGRERSTNVIDVPHDKAKIVRAIRKALYDKKFKEQVRRCVSPYGD
ncbi:UDP-N-acetylglucosamine 2-epimerase (hydrolyzing), partial [Candidatus Gottesmanbacteria bacterium]|nr:UDP-N-acetylglucosamine 2-epimerase (hydrolyzing) [Candidatus Gottesmanbacteria bacterium]